MFLHRLAGHVGEPSVTSLSEELTEDELVHWMAYFELEPFGEAADWYRHGDRQAITANINRDKKKKPTPFKHSDFLPHNAD